MPTIILLSPAATSKLAGLILGLALTCAALTGCGASTTTAGAAPPTATVTPATPATATASTQAQTCQSSQLTLALDHTGVALGHVASVLRLDNSSQQACTLDGYPTVQLLDARQQPLPTHQQQTTMAYTFTVPVPQPVVLASGASAYFHLEWSDMPPSGQSCSYNAAYLQVTPPQNQTPLPILPGFGTSICDGNIITSPIVPSSAY
jgi:Protein of unknown function (DUF4232)